MASYLDPHRKELFERIRKGGPGIFSQGRGKKRSVTYTDPRGVVRTATTEPKSGRFIPKGMEGKKFVRKSDIITSGAKKGGQLKAAGVFSTAQAIKTTKTAGPAKTNLKVKPARPAESAGASRAAAPPKTVETKSPDIIVQEQSKSSDGVSLKGIGIGAGVAGAVYLASRRLKPEETPTAKANKVSRAPSRTQRQKPSQETPPQKVKIKATRRQATPQGVSVKPEGIKPVGGPLKRSPEEIAKREAERTARIGSKKTRISMRGMAKALTSSVVKGTDPEKAIAAQTAKETTTAKAPSLASTQAERDAITAKAYQDYRTRTPEVKGTTAQQEGSSKSAGRSVRVRGKKVQVVSKKSTGDSVQTKTQVTTVKTPSVEQKPQTTTVSQAGSATDSPSKIQGNRAVDSAGRTIIRLTRATPTTPPSLKTTEGKAVIPEPGKTGAHLGFAKSVFRTEGTKQSSIPTPTTTVRTRVKAPVQPDVTSPVRAVESPTVAGIDPNVAKTKIILRKRTPKADIGVPLPVKAKPAEITVSSAEKAAETKAARTQQEAVRGTRPGKVGVATQETLAKMPEIEAKRAAKLAELERLKAEAPPTLREIPKEKLKPTKRIKKMREQAGSAPTRIPPGRAAELQSRKSQIESFMETKGYTKVEGQGEEAKPVKVEPTVKQKIEVKPSKKPRVSTPKPKATEVKAESAPKLKGDYSPEVNKILIDVAARKGQSYGRFWWKKAAAAAKQGAKGLPGLMAVDLIDRIVRAPSGEKAKEAKLAAKESAAIGTGMTILEKVTPKIARGAMRGLAPVALAATVADVAPTALEALRQGREIFRGLKHKRRTERYAREKYGTIEAATKTRRSRKL